MALRFEVCNIRVSGLSYEQRILLYVFIHFFVAFHHKCVFINFIYFFDEVSNLLSIIYINHKQIIGNKALLVELQAR